MDKHLNFIFDYSKSLPWLADRTIFLTITGSQAYGTNIATSDTDYKGVTVPPKEYFYGLKKFEQVDKFNGVDCTIFDIRKFVSLAADCNPDIIEMLYTAPADQLIKTDVGALLVENRGLFLSKKARWTFQGYAFAQLKRIKGHYRWLKQLPTHKPTREECGLPEHMVVPADQLNAAWALIRKRMDSWNPDFSGLAPAETIKLQVNIDTVLQEIVGSTLYLGEKENLWPHAAAYEGFSTNFIEVIQKEKAYKGKLTEWQQYQEWLANRNEARAELEAKYGYDVKHGMHLCRLCRMCREILETGEVIVKRPDAEELKSIRNGAWPYEKLVAWAEEQEASMDALYAKSTLPKAPNREKIDQLLVEIVERSQKPSSNVPSPSLHK